MKRVFYVNTIVIGQVFGLIQLADGQQSSSPTTVTPSDPNDRVTVLLERLADAHQRALETAEKAQKREIEVIRSAHADVVQSQQLRIDSTLADLTAARSQINQLQQANRRQSQQIEELHTQMQKWRTLASPSYITSLERMQERSGQLAKQDDERKTQVSRLVDKAERERRAMNDILKLNSTWKTELALRRQEYLQHQALVQDIRSKNQSSYRFSGKSFSLQNGKQTSKRMDELKSRIDQLNDAIARLKKTYREREQKLKDINERIKPIKNERMQHLERLEMLDRAFDRALLASHGLRD